MCGRLDRRLATELSMSFWDTVASNSSGSQFFVSLHIFHEHCFSSFCLVPNFLLPPLARIRLGGLDYLDYPPSLIYYSTGKDRCH